ncbi:MAG: PASTA domain-containing protein [Candidatus Nanopelagicales bacterium]
MDFATPAFVDATGAALAPSYLPWALAFLLVGLLLAGVLVLWFRRGYALRSPDTGRNNLLSGENGTGPGTPVATSGESGSDDGTRSPGERDSAVFVRSLLALWLVLGLVGFTLLAFWIDDDNLRSTLIGGLTASTGAAVAYYFSSKASDDARKDILAATPGLNASIEVPSFVGESLDKALRLLAANQDLRGRPIPADADATNTVTAQIPAAGTLVARGTTVELTADPSTTAT